MPDLTALSATQLARLIGTREVSCVEVMEAHLRQIARVNPALNALVQQLSPEQALDQARQADAVRAPRGKLHGVPVTIKDGRKVKGFLCSLGTRSPHNGVPDEDATLVARLRAQGAIILGLANIPDFEMSFETDNLLYGRTKNPYDLARSPGGSGGGQAAVIAAQLSPLGIGADRGGSIRQPAHNCGIVGLKPTRGLLPNTGKFPTDGWGIFSYIACQGPTARFVADLIETLAILAGPDGRDPDVIPIPVRDPLQVDLRTLRAAFYTANGVVTPRQDVTETVRKAALALSREVAGMQEHHPAILPETHLMLEELLYYGGDRGQWLRDMMRSMQVTEVARPFQEILARAEQCVFSVTELRRRLVELDRFKMAMLDFMRPYDVLLCPVAAAPAALYENVGAPDEGPGIGLDLTYNVPYSVTGWPAAVVRCGTSSEGLPIGVQVVARPWRDDVSLAVARRLEEIFGGWQPPDLAAMQT
jgi:amidase